MKKFERVIGLLGEEKFNKLQQIKVIIFGVGGVGSFCLDALYRTGITNITIVDYDIFEESNQNRQIGSQFLGEKKVFALKKLYPNITAIDTLVTPSWIENFDFSSFDFVVDAIDDIPSKVALAKKTHKNLISSCGSAKKTDPTKIEIDSIWKTYNDPFAKKFRYELKKSGFNNDFKVVFSSQLPKKTKELGSLVQVTGSFGLALASLIINQV